METKTYTQKEISFNIETLNNKRENLKLERTQINQQINSLKKQIEFWNSLDTSQYKMFDNF